MDETRSQPEQEAQEEQRPRPVLDRLAERMGIEPAYISAAGHPVVTPPEVKRRLLRAMGTEVRDEDDARLRLLALERYDIARPLPPVIVVREDRLPLEVPIVLPLGTPAIDWAVRLERDGRVTGRTAPGDLPLIDRPVAGLERRRLTVPGRLPLGYHTLAVSGAVSGGGLDGEAAATVIVVPATCWLPPELAQGKRLWGIAAQIYQLRSATNWGIGDFSDLGRLAVIAAGLGASVIGVNPLHAMFTDRPEQASPYSPLRRLFLNILYIDITATPEATDDEELRRLMRDESFASALTAARQAPLVDYPAVARLKLAALERLFERFRQSAAPGRVAQFDTFRREQGEPLERMVRFQALREHFSANDPDDADWRRWPEPYRDPASAAVEAFAGSHRDRLDFLAWTQWIADRQLAAAARIARERGLAIGVYRDLAVGADGGGAESWANPGLIAAEAHAGAPPDVFNPAGQDWGLPPVNPRAMREEAYAGFIRLLRANMRHAGGLRIDHAMALKHLYWIPAGNRPGEGAYVSYPLEDLLGIVALESRRNRCLVVGEDLGTVPEGFRERLGEAGILSYRVLFFEHDADGRFIPPDRYPHLALATIGSHDLPTLRGWWEGRDIDLRDRLDLYPTPDEAGRQRAWRARARVELCNALAADGPPPSPDAPMTDELAERVHRFLARTSAAIAMVQLEDLTDEAEQVNLPGTVTEHPNWRRKIGLTLEELAGDPRVRALTGMLREVRGAAAASGSFSDGEHNMAETPKTPPQEHAATGAGAPDAGPDAGKDSNRQKDPEDWVTGEEPMTGAQASYIQTLAEEVGETFDPDMTKAEASRRIDDLRRRSKRLR